MNSRRFLVLRFEGPLMSFGGVAVDEHSVTLSFPSLSMLTGLLSNALGYDHRDTNLLQRMQERICFGARRDRKGEHIVDFQTVDLGQEFLMESWTTHDKPEGRGGGSARVGTHIRYRHYLADSVFTLVLTLEPADEEPDLDRVAKALREPERPLFLGRKSCIPSAPIFVADINAVAIRDALVKAPLSERADNGDWLAWWPIDNETPPSANKGRQVPIADRRDWANSIHVGSRSIWEAPLPRLEVSSGE